VVPDEHIIDDDRRLLRQIKLENLLSFGPDTAPLELQNLNILIGPNAAGKSNLIEALSLMRSTPVSGTAGSTDLRGIVTARRRCQRVAMERQQETHRVH
jgi:recombinational DNA repair ATPase RecF